MADAARRPPPRCSRSHDLCAGYGSSQVLDHVSFAMGVEAVGDHRTQRHGQVDAVQHADGAACRRVRARFALGRHDAHRPATRAHRPGRHRLRARRVGGCSRRSPSTSTSRCSPRRRAASGGRRRRLELFPRLAQRRRSRAGDLSGGEQQMLAVGRALLLNGSLLMMDEPSEGLAPTIVDTLIEAVHRLVERGRRRARRRAEPLRRHAHGRAHARDGRRAHRGRDDGRPRSSTTRCSSAATSASTRSRPRTTAERNAS